MARDVGLLGALRAAGAEAVVVDTAPMIFRLERRADLGELRRHGLPVLEWRPPQPLEAALAESGRRRVRLANAG